MQFANPGAVRRRYDDALHALLNRAEARASRDALAHWPLLARHATPAWALPGLARELGLASLTLKDESRRSPLGSFKALGAPAALLRLVQRRWPGRGWTAAGLFAGEHAASLRDWVVTSATDGNHGRALAAAAQSVGCRCVIVLHAQVSAEREAAIAAHGAEIVRIAGNYDDSVAEAARLAAAHGWQVVSDTSSLHADFAPVRPEPVEAGPRSLRGHFDKLRTGFDTLSPNGQATGGALDPGHEEVPRDVMQGYAVIAEELFEALPEGAPCPYTHVVVQGGVGGLAAALAAAFWEREGAQRPRLVVVEPEAADCLLQSARAGRPARASGSVDSVMAGLACGEASPLAWRFLQPTVDLFMTVDDAQAVAAMRTLAAGAGGDIPVLAGESGAAGLAALQALAADAEARAALALDGTARVLLVNTEGATAPAVYTRLVGQAPAAVLAAQQAWLAREGIAEAPLSARLEALAAVGAIEHGGVCRMALTDADRAGRDLVAGWMRELGLELKVDRVGNLFGIRPGRSGEAAVMTGSHIDTVATGGRYDGSYGVLAGLEVVRRLNERGETTRRPLVVAAFSNEEGVRYPPDMMGSLVHAGGLPLQEALGTVGIDGTRYGDELARIGYAGGQDCGAIVPHAYVELHIEQGPVLEAEGVTIGAVQDLQGISWQELTVTGQSNHAGTTPMRLRRDAGHCAAAIAVFVRELALRLGGSQVATVGAIRLHPNLINVIAARATLTVDLRNTDEALLRQAEAELAAFLQRLAGEQQVTIESRRLARFEPVVFDTRLVRRIEGAAAARGLSVRRMTSGAGHDAQMIARIAPAAMIFVPSVGGISHNPREHTSPADLAHGASVLLDVLRALADE